MAQPLPTSLYEDLFGKLANVLEITQKPEGVSTTQTKQALLQATSDFKNAMAQARDLAVNLPGGELMLDEQDEVIRMLEQLRDRKRDQLVQFSNRVLTSSATTAELKMEIDSMASTPFNE